MHYMLRRLRRVKMILPALTEATSPYWRPIKYSLFPPLGLATLAAYLDPTTEISLQDEHVEPLDLDDDPDLVVIQVYITNAYRAYRIADHYRRKGAHVALGGLHVTSLPEEAASHADTIFLGPGEDLIIARLSGEKIERTGDTAEAIMARAAATNPLGRAAIVRRSPGDVAQLVAHHLCKVGVVGSSPIVSTGRFTPSPSRRRQSPLRGRR